MNTLQHLLICLARVINMNTNDRVSKVKENAIYLKNSQYENYTPDKHYERGLLVVRGTERFNGSICQSTIWDDNYELYVPAQHIDNTLSEGDNNLLITTFKLFLRYKNQERFFDMYEIHAYHYQSNECTKHLEIGLYRNKLSMKNLLRIACYYRLNGGGAVFDNFITSFPENTRVTIKPKL